MEHKNLILTIIRWTSIPMVLVSFGISAWSGMLDGPRFIIYTGFLLFFWWITEEKAKCEMCGDELSEGYDVYCIHCEDDLDGRNESYTEESENRIKVVKCYKEGGKTIDIYKKK